MKFNCGTDYQTWYKLKTNWHRWFAWYPVRVGNCDCRWLEYVERCYEDSYEGLYPTYRAITKTDDAIH